MTYNSSKTGAQVDNAVTDVENAKAASPTDTTADRLLKVGDFGVGSTGFDTEAVASLDSSSLNFALKSYGIADLSKPFVNGGWFLTLPQTTDRAHQLASEHSVNNIAIRYTSNAGTTWSSWAELLHTGNTPIQPNATNLLVNTTTLNPTVSYPLQPTTLYNGRAQINAGLRGAAILDWSSNRFTSASLVLGRSPSGAEGNYSAAVNDGGGVGAIMFNGSDGTKFALGAMIQARGAGTWSSTATPTALTFHTGSSSTNSPAERLRIDSSGNVLVGTTSSTGEKVQIDGDLKVTGGMGIYTGSKSFNVSTSSTPVIKLDKSGHFAAELTITFNDSAFPNGSFIQKLYIATRGSGTNVLSVDILVEDKARMQGGSSFTDYFTWTAAVVNNRVELSASASLASGSGLLLVNSFGSPFTWLV